MLASAGDTVDVQIFGSSFTNFGVRTEVSFSGF
jgi:hypothetical protein